MDLRQYVLTWLKLLLRRRLQRAVVAELAAEKARTVVKLRDAVEATAAFKAPNTLELGAVTKPKTSVTIEAVTFRRG